MNIADAIKRRDAAQKVLTQAEMLVQTYEQEQESLQELLQHEGIDENEIDVHILSLKTQLENIEKGIEADLVDLEALVDEAVAVLENK